ncbi:MAG: AIR carboxylase family protein [Patescibacteria group bacterium]
MKCILLLGSIKDESHAKKITDELNKFGIQWEEHVASAHKEAKKLLAILEKYKNKKVIYVTIAGRSNALSGFIAGNSDKVTIACPPFKDKHDMLLNIHSTLQMPSKVPVLTVLDPANAALAVKRVMSLMV